MTELKAVNLEQITQGIRAAVKPVSVLWQTADSIAFVARGRQHRSEFHVDPSDEIMYMIKGDVDLHYIKEFYSTETHRTCGKCGHVTSGGERAPSG